MEIEGKIIKELQVRTGISSRTNQPWRIASYVLETIDRYPQRLVFDVSDGLDNRIDKFKIREGKRFKIFFSFSADEYEGKWYNHIQCYEAREIKEQNETEQ